jgi:hypothetical protein
MTRLIQQPVIEVSATIKLTEPELMALACLASYGTVAFLEAFYKYMGKAHLQPHAAGITSLFEVIRADLGPIVARAEAAKKAFALRDPVIRSRVDHDALIARLTSTTEGKATS